MRNPRIVDDIDDSIETERTFADFLMTIFALAGSFLLSFK